MDSPFWIALSAECRLAADQVAAGGVSVGNLDPMNPGSFYSAFFPLSIGYERMAKIAIQVDARVEHGSFLPKSKMRGLSHDIARSFDEVEKIARRRGYETERFGVRPSEPVHASVVSVLSNFATTSRYNHLDAIGSAGQSGTSAEKEWDTAVLPLLVEEHLTKRTAQKIVDGASGIGIAFDEADVYIGRQRDVDGTLHTKPAPPAFRGLLYEALNPYGRMHTLQLARWLATVLTSLGHDAIMTGEVPYLSEFFSWMRADDQALRTRRNLSGR